MPPRELRKITTCPGGQAFERLSLARGNACSRLSQISAYTRVSQDCIESSALTSARAQPSLTQC